MGDYDYADPARYEELIDALKSFKRRISEACDGMDDAATTCVDCTDDESAKNAAANLKTHTQYMRGELDKVDEVIQKLEEELEDLINSILSRD